MKKIWLCLGLALLLLGGASLGTSPAHAAGVEFYIGPGPGYCYGYPYDYCDYYYAPYADPYTQFYFYNVPEFGEEFEEHEHFEHRGGHERFEGGREFRGGHEGGHRR